MKITLADHYGMCFGVRDALRATHELAATKKVTVLGQLVHNPVVSAHLASLGVASGDLDDFDSATTGDVVITAHGASHRDRAAWEKTGRTVADTTCPLVRKAHTALAQLVAGGFFPVVVGKAGHVEVRGLIGDFPHAFVALTATDIDSLPFREKIGVISQTTQPIALVEALVERIRARHPSAEVRFVDTVCHPTKDRQSALEKLCRESEVVIAVGGHNSNNTAQLVRTAAGLGATAHHVATPGEIDPLWFEGVASVGITAGTSTLDETVIAVRDRIQEIAAARRKRRLFARSRPAK